MFYMLGINAFFIQTIFFFFFFFSFVHSLFIYFEILYNVLCLIKLICCSKAKRPKRKWSRGLDFFFFKLSGCLRFFFVQALGQSFLLFGQWKWLYNIPEGVNLQPAMVTHWVCVFCAWTVECRWVVPVGHRPPVAAAPDPPRAAVFARGACRTESRGSWLTGHAYGTRPGSPVPAAVRPGKRTWAPGRCEDWWSPPVRRDGAAGNTAASDGESLTSTRPGSRPGGCAGTRSGRTGGVRACTGGSWENTGRQIRFR